MEGKRVGSEEALTCNPHLGSASRETRDKIATMAATNAIAMLKKEQAPNIVNPEVYQTDAYRRRIKAS